MVKDPGFAIRRSESQFPHEIVSLTFRCKKCKGEKVVKDKKRVEFQIEPGTENGERIALRGEGDEIVCPHLHDVHIAYSRISPTYRPETSFSISVTVHIPYSNLTTVPVDCPQR